jgi:ABC-type multidrug transport system ATPase subunit
MARAIYSNADLNLLDDPLSACDAKVGSALFFNGIIDQLVKRGKSVILATHQLQYLPYANKILVLSPSGKQVFYGTFSKLKEMMSSNDSSNHDDDDNDDKRSLDFLKATNLFAENNNDNDKTIIDSSNNDNDNDTRMKKYQKSINIEKRHKINELKEIISEEDRIEGPITIMIITIITIIIIIIIIIITIKVKYL